MPARARTRQSLGMRSAGRRSVAEFGGAHLNSRLLEFGSSGAPLQAKVPLGVLFLLTNGRSINFFSLKQDVEIGSESAKEAEQSLSLVRDLNIAGYFLTIGQRLSQNSTLPALRYHFRIVNSREVNSLGFPGGGVYIYRGLLHIASNDDELAAILAHEIAHIASRHGTAQLSRQLIVQAQIGRAAGLPATEAWKEELGKLGIP